MQIRPRSSVFWKSQIEDVAGNVLSKRFEAAHHDTINSGKLLDDIGYLGATPPAVEEISEGKYVFPPDMDTHT